MLFFFFIFNSSAFLVARPLTWQQRPVTCEVLKTFPQQLHVHHNFLKFPRDRKSPLGQSTKTLVLMQHQEQITLQINICRPHWADFPISAKRWMPHVNGDSQLTKQKGKGRWEERKTEIFISCHSGSRLKGVIKVRYPFPHWLRELMQWPFARTPSVISQLLTL